MTRTASRIAISFKRRRFRSSKSFCGQAETKELTWGLRVIYVFIFYPSRKSSKDKREILRANLILSLNKC